MTPRPKQAKRARPAATHESAKHSPPSDSECQAGVPKAQVCPQLLDWVGSKHAPRRNRSSELRNANETTKRQRQLTCTMHRGHLTTIPPLLLPAPITLQTHYAERRSHLHKALLQRKTSAHAVQAGRLIALTANKGKPQTRTLRRFAQQAALPSNYGPP